ncbi:MAG TPA: phosphoribosyltransferase family protein [Candidatus Paceibacterota bacterium]|nr:phosphoribosyltransferase family protein [Candidatus Paceibacterota bacterium]
MLKLFKSILVLAADVVAPADPDIAAIERMTTEEFLKKARPDAASGRAEHDGVISLFPYRSAAAKAALVEIKERSNRRIADLLGKILFDELKAMEMPEGSIVIPTPITKKKRLTRGWNQCDLIVEGLARADIHDRFEVRTDILIKTRETADQVGKNKIERFENVRNTLAIQRSRGDRGAPPFLAGKTVVVIDDIVTTGATLGEARRALAEGGAEKIITLALGR